MEKNIYIAPVLRIIEIQLETIIAQSGDFEGVTTTQSPHEWEDEE